MIDYEALILDQQEAEAHPEIIMLTDREIEEIHRVTKLKQSEAKMNVDVTDQAISDIRVRPVPVHLKSVKPAVHLTSAGLRVRASCEGLLLGSTSRAVVHDDGVKHLSKRDHKILLGLILGGFVKVFKVAGKLPGDHPPRRVGSQGEYHYKLEPCVRMN